MSDDPDDDQECICLTRSRPGTLLSSLYTNKKPFIPAGRKDFPWYHPNSHLVRIFHIGDLSLVDLRGLEPLTSSMPWMRSSSCATGPYILRCTLIARDIGRTGRPYTPAGSSLLPAGLSDLLLTGEFSQIKIDSLAPTGYSLSQPWLTTPAHCII
jgi:hypothetical protein